MKPFSQSRGVYSCHSLQKRTAFCLKTIGLVILKTNNKQKVQSFCLLVYIKHTRTQENNFCSYKCTKLTIINALLRYKKHPHNIPYYRVVYYPISYFLTGWMENNDKVLIVLRKSLLLCYFFFNVHIKKCEYATNCCIFFLKKKKKRERDEIYFCNS
jgi:hypothetical protein